MLEQDKIYLEYVKEVKVLKFLILRDIFSRLLSLNSEINLYQLLCHICFRLLNAMRNNSYYCYIYILGPYPEPGVSGDIIAPGAGEHQDHHHHYDLTFVTIV